MTSGISVDGAVRSEYRLTNWLALMADFLAMADLTDFEYAQSAQAATTQVPDPAQFIDFQVYGGVRAHY